MKLLPLGVGGFAVFLDWSDGAAFVEESPIGPDQLVLEHRQVGLGGADVVVAGPSRSGSVTREG